MKALDVLKHVEVNDLCNGDYTTFSTDFEEGPGNGEKEICRILGNGTVKGKVKDNTEYVAFYGEDNAPGCDTPDILLCLEDDNLNVYIFEIE